MLNEDSHSHSIFTQNQVQIVNTIYDKVDYEFQKHSEHKPSSQTEERVGEKAQSFLVGAALSRKHEDKHFMNAKRDINHWEQGAMAAPYETGNIRVH